MVASAMFTQVLLPAHTVMLKYSQERCSKEWSELVQKLKSNAHSCSAHEQAQETQEVMALVSLAKQQWPSCATDPAQAGAQATLRGPLIVLI